MHIKHITIQNFRNFKNFEIDFSEGFQTIIGENNIGKSNLYWAIRLVLDKNLSYNSRNLELKDFHGFRNKLNIDDYILVSIEMFSKKLSEFPTFHALKTSDDTARVTFLFAHKLKFNSEFEIGETIEMSDFRWQLFGGGNSLKIDDILQLTSIRMSDLEGINLYYLNAFRNTSTELHGSTKSLLSKFCISRENSDGELQEVKDILRKSSDSLNELSFIPKIASNIEEKGKNIAGDYFSFPISLSFISNYDIDAWSQLNVYYNPTDGVNIPIQSLGLGQKNILYLSLFIAELENSSSDFEINILLIEEPEAHLHPQLQKVLFSNLNQLKTTQVFLSSHSTHIASDCEYKNLNILYLNLLKEVKSFSPFKENLLLDRERLLLKRYLDATRSEIFFSSAIIYVEGVSEQFIIPIIAKEKYNIDLTEHNISIVPIHSRFFDPYLKLVNDNNLEIPAVAIIDGDSHLTDEESSFIANAKKLEVENRVIVCEGTNTLEIDIFPNPDINSKYLEQCFINLGHSISYQNLLETIKSNKELWQEELLKRIDGTIKKGRFAQELSLLIDKDFIVPPYIERAIKHIISCKKLQYGVS
ncbi:AAA family ATPase [Chryseobacterium sp. B21-037]|uniref:ATP-dependent nuclease n=1 Tax=Chryseobacterium sp. B21-037 TaxID=2926038 RepID=UPI002359B153|nr:AAA family ATPase [Chryseobacterium sp. B21-037]MDC8106710.1 AAA family ATPase [Chryseobacterium sp. B21-037]